jgi:hypothetical protein
MKTLTLKNITGQPFTVEIKDGKKSKTYHFEPHGEIKMPADHAKQTTDAFPNIHPVKPKK